MNDNIYLLAVLLLAAGVTFLIRAVPLLLGSRFVQSHPWMRSLGDFLPLSVMVILVLCGARSMDSTVASFVDFCRCGFVHGVC